MLYKKEPSMVCVNEDDNGLVTLFRVYPDSLKDKANIHALASEQYKNEFFNKDYKKI